MTADGEVHLKIEGLTKRFGPFVALRDIALEVGEGEFVCFLGPSGCGKTTLLRIIAGLERQSTGRIWQRGGEISLLPPSERDFGIVFQSYALFPNLRIGENVAYGLENTRMARADINRRVDELLETVGCTEQHGKFPAQLSGGQQQRVALARALATSPSLLLLDEPLSAIDAKVRLRLRREIKRLQRKFGVTTIMVTHDQEEALTIADRIAVMNHGVIEQIGGPREIYRRPASVFVADFVGAMNFLDGKVVASDGVQVGESRINCDASGFSIGAKVTVAFRPEEVVCPANDNDSDLCCCCCVEQTEFLGPSTKLLLRSDALDDAEFFAERSADDSASAADFAQGAEIKIRLPSSRLRLFASQ